MAAGEDRRRGTVATFYSYKGGVGRTMALANTACLLASWGKRVLCVDWDLEAPGLLRFLPPDRDSGLGLLDLVDERDGEPIRWEDAVCPVSVRFETAGRPVRLDVLPPGAPAGYDRRVQVFDWRRRYEAGLGERLEELRDAWVRRYDWVLIDSRTGLTDTGGICTVQLPDILVLLANPNSQAIDGAHSVWRLVNERRAEAAFDRTRLLTLPVLTRFDDRAEYEDARAWERRFAAQFGDAYAEWCDRDIAPEQILALTRVPHVSFWSFGERLPVLAASEGAPGTLGYVYENLAALLAHHLDKSKSLARDRDAFVRSAKGSSTSDGPATSEGEGREASNPPSRLDPGWILRVPLPFGLRYDFFISYSRRDSAAYAEDLARLLRQSGHTCYLDETQNFAGVALSDTIRRALLDSRALVVIATSGIADSAWVAQEVASFPAGPRRPLIPISVQRYLSRPSSSPTVRLLQERVWIDDPEMRPGERAADDIGNVGVLRHPGDHVLEELAGFFSFARRTAVVRAILVAVAFVMAGLVVWGGYIRPLQRRTELTTRVQNVEVPEAERANALRELCTLHQEQGWPLELPGVRLSGLHLQGLECPAGLDLRNAELVGTILNRATLPGVQLTGAAARDVQLNGAVLQGANLAGADLLRAELREADMVELQADYGTRLALADLSGARLGGARLVGTDLSGSTLTNADLRRALLAKAFLGGAILRDAETEGGGWRDATCPDGTRLGEEGGCSPEFDTFDSCQQARERGESVSHFYTLKPPATPDAPRDGRAFQAYCDMETEGGGWTLLLAPGMGDHGLDEAGVPTPFFQPKEQTHARLVFRGGPMSSGDLEQVAQRVWFSSIRFEEAGYRYRLVDSPAAPPALTIPRDMLAFADEHGTMYRQNLRCWWKSRPGREGSPLDGRERSSTFLDALQSSYRWQPEPGNACKGCFWWWSGHEVLEGDHTRAESLLGCLTPVSPTACAGEQCGLSRAFVERYGDMFQELRGIGTRVETARKAQRTRFQCEGELCDKTVTFGRARHRHHYRADDTVWIR